MSQDVDIDEPFEEALQHGMALSAQIGRELARAWRAQLEEKVRTDDRTAALVQKAFNTERDTAVATLAPTKEPHWWDEASVRDICDAYELANTWAEHDPWAKQAEETLRLAAAERYGIDPERLLREGHRQTETIMNTPPERLAQAQRWARLEGWKNDIPEFYPEAQKLHNLLSDYDRAVQSEARNAARTDGIPVAEATQKAAATDIPVPAVNVAALDKQAREKAAWAWLRETDPARAKEGDRLSGTWMEGDKETAHERFTNQIVKEWEAAAARELERGDVKAEDAKQLHGDAAREKERAEKPTSEQEQASVDTAKAAAEKSAKQRENAGDKAAAQASGAYDRASQLQAEAERMRAAGAPEKAIAAKQFGEAQQKYPAAHAAAGKGKTTGKVKANSVQRLQSQGQHLGR